MANGILPRGAGITRRGLDAMIRDIMAYYPKAFEEAYVAEMEIMLKQLIDTTPIDTGAAAGVTSNSVGSQKRSYYSGHKAQPANIGNNPGDTGWQLEKEGEGKKLKLSIVNPQWDSYLKYLELGIVEPVAPAKPHFAYDTVVEHYKRRDAIAEKVRRGRS
jgi:hypothetical protein